MAIYSLVFAVYMRVQLPAYPAFVFAGLLPWIWFSSSLLRGATAIVESGDLLKKVYFPPQILPAVVVASALVNFVLSLPLLVGFMLLSGVGVHWTLLALPVPLAIQTALTLALALGVAVLNTRYRDVYHLVASLLTLWFFLTPVLYPADAVPEPLRALLVLNPMATLTLAFQDVLYYHRWLDVRTLAPVGIVSVALLAAALWATERWRWLIVEEV